MVESSNPRISLFRRAKTSTANIQLAALHGQNLVAWYVSCCTTPLSGINRHKNIRAAQCFNLKSTKLSRLHNDANIITLGSRLLTKKNALNCVGVFLNTKFEGGRHLKRIKKI